MTGPVGYIISNGQRRSMQGIWVTKPDAAISQANPVSGTIYPVLAATTSPTRILGVVCSVTWTVQPTPLELYIIIDGITFTYAVVNPISTQGYEPRKQGQYAPDGNELVVSPNQISYYPYLMEGKTVSISAETTGGTVSNISCRVRYALLE